MPKLITKSLFVDYTTFPKLARRKANNPTKYKFIKKIESEEDSEKIIRLGQEVEDAVAKYLERKHQATKLDLFPSMPTRQMSADGEEEDEDAWIYEQDKRNYFERITEACEKTIEAMKNKEPLLYQPSFLIDDCFVRADFMVLSSNGSYDLLEVKAKTSVRKKMKNNGEDEAIGEILKNLQNDVGFQKYVINKVLSTNNLGKLNDVYLVHLNKDYVKKGPLDVMELIKQELTDKFETITVLQGKKDNPKEKEKDIDDILMQDSEVESIVATIKSEITLDEEAINEIHPFPGNKYVEHFGEDRPFGTIMGRGVHHSKKAVISELYEQGITKIDELDDEQKAMFISQSSKDGVGSSRKFIDNYLSVKAGNNPIIDHGEVSDFFSNFKKPICFYDYETISVPIPYLDNTYPYQQVVVQYSLHKYYNDGSMKHYGGIYVGEGEKKIEQVTIPNNTNLVGFESEKTVTGTFKDLLEEFIKDIGDDRKDSSFIVWNKGFENARNREIGKLFKDLEDSYLAINERTYDLMEVASKSMYFDIGFQGSASIKKVLPVLVPSMTYDGMDIANGSFAMEALFKLVSNQYTDPAEKEKITQELLRYCGQDSLAMVKIWEAIAEQL